MKAVPETNMISIIFSLQPLYALSGLSVVFLLKKEALIRKVNGSIPNFKFELINELLVVKVSKQARLVVLIIYLRVC